MIGFVKSPPISLLKEALVTGAPVFVFMAMSFVKSLGLNMIIIHLTGQDGMAIYTVCDNILMIVEMLSGALSGLFPTWQGSCTAKRIITAYARCAKRHYSTVLWWWASPFSASWY